MIIERKIYLKKIEPFIGKNIIKVLTGIRRSGKSIILQQIVTKLKNSGINEENIILINFELSEFSNLKTLDNLEKYIEEKISNNKGKKYLLFDEIQEVDHWEKLINSYFAKGEYDIYITGSNSKLLSGELATYLSGRYIEIKIYPFSFKEYIEFKDMDNFDKRIEFDNYLKTGGMPSTIEYDYSQKMLILTDIYNSIVLKDIIERKSIKNVNLLQRIIQFIMQNVGRLISANSIVKYLKNDKISLSVNTVYNYLTYLEDACIIHQVKREDLIGKKILKHEEKYYLTDLGFREAIFGNNSRDIAQSIENIVYMELLRRDYQVTIGKLNNIEVDFTCKKQGKPIYIQVSYVLYSEDTINREFKPLLKIKDNYSKYVITLDSFDMSREGIKHLNLIDFLLNTDDKL